MKNKIIVTGGTGYIGSHTAIDLILNGFEVIILDDLSRSSIDSIDRIEKITNVRPKFHQINLTDKEKLDQFFEKEGNITGIIHFAAYKYVDESVLKPLLYFRNNLESQINVMEMAEKYRVPYFVFSSSCSVYGNISELPVKETTPLNSAESAYARTKQIGEMMINDIVKVSYSRYISLRYFNPVGAHESGLIGESPTVVPNNLIPRIIGTATGEFPVLKIFGTELPTRDGSCIRDYIHVMDVAEAHTAALHYLMSNKSTEKHEIINLGSGDGISVLEMVKAFEENIGIRINVEYAPPRAGDVVAIYSDCMLSAEKLGWKSKRDINQIMRDTWNWEQNKLKNIHQTN